MNSGCGSPAGAPSREGAKRQRREVGNRKCGFGACAGSGVREVEAFDCDSHFSLVIFHFSLLVAGVLDAEPKRDGPRTKILDAEGAEGRRGKRRRMVTRGHGEPTVTGLPKPQTTETPKHRLHSTTCSALTLPCALCVYLLPRTSHLLPLTSYLLPLTSYLLPLTSLPQVSGGSVEANCRHVACDSLRPLRGFSSASSAFNFVLGIRRTKRRERRGKTLRTQRDVHTKARGVWGLKH